MSKLNAAMLLKLKAVSRITSLDERCFNNPFKSDNEKASAEGQEQNLTYFNEQGQTCREALLAKIIDAMENPYESYDDFSIYTGRGGIAWTLLRVDPDNDLGRREWSLETLEKARTELNKKSPNSVSFLKGEAGPLAILAVEYYIQSEHEKANQNAKALLELAPKVLDLDDPEIGDDVLTGRAGYLYSLLYVKSNCLDLENEVGDELTSTIRNVMEAILASGIKGSTRFRSASPLMYEWKGRQYFGAATGLVGILYTLLEAKDWIKPDELTDLVKPSIDYLVKRRFPTGNLPAFKGSEEDQQVQWCHGAPGAIHLFLKAYALTTFRSGLVNNFTDNFVFFYRKEVFGVLAYLEAAKIFAKITWRRGLLKKGYSLCHGTAGNAYAFLGLYQATKNPVFLWKARCFGEFIFSHGRHGCRTPDRPFSLYEGHAGMAFFLDEIMKDPVAARFPGFQIKLI